MYGYSLTQWLAFFYLYCFLGWCFESAYVSILNHRWVNRGFMTGPYIPLYGSGAVLVLFVTLPMRGNVVLMFLAGAAAATILEYVTGVVMERLFGIRYWDYSDKRFNFQGHICLEASILWGFLTLLLVYGIHRPIESLVYLMEETWLTSITFCMTVVFTFDFALAFRTAIDLRDVLVQAEKARREIGLMQKRVEVLEAVLLEDINDSVGNVVDGLNDSVENVVESLGNRVDEQKQRVSELAEEKLAELSLHMEGLKQRVEASESFERLRNALEASELNDRLEDIQAEVKQMRSKVEGLRMHVRIKMTPGQIRMLRRNPSAVSSRYKKEWQYLKDKLTHSEEDED